MKVLQSEKPMLKLGSEFKSDQTETLIEKVERLAKDA